MDESLPLGGMEGGRERALIEPKAARRFGNRDRTPYPRADRHQRHGLMLRRRCTVELQSDPLPYTGCHFLDRVLPRTGSGADGHRPATAYEDLDTAAFVDAACRPIDVV